MDNDTIIQAYLDEQERLKQVQLMHLRNNLSTFTLKELKKEIIKMKADKLAVTKMNRERLVNLIINYH